ncbi:transcription-repair coupling factor [Herbivorax sp. ANBcel31]|uniref:transcription-repair coupling factor n=1 Tax=Herbivorax sp. ANBcel31 TaxID=3069754 RepID=UPI0027B5F205|nr:transcription-repair coupling factor [Herbivorax sp. ANBcel31]MDQ2086522.1 transcription-repair coupling factor [Herbivorax sp. ANBcel31]
MNNVKEKKYLINPLMEINQYRDALNRIKTGNTPISIEGSSQSQKAHTTYAVLRHLKQKGIFIANNDISARKIYEDFLNFFEEGVLYFSPGEIMFHDVEARSHDSSYERIKSLYKIINGEYQIIVTSAEAIARKLIDKELFCNSIISFSIGEIMDLSVISEKLISIGYERMPVVEGKGQFAVRGGIIDIFPINSETAARVEFFGDEIDSIRSFDVASQRSLERIERVTVLPAREVVYNANKRDDILNAISDSLNQYLKKIGKIDVEGFNEKIEEKIKYDMERFKQQYYFAGMDRYIPYIIEKPSIITDYMDMEKVLIFLDEPKRFEKRYENLLYENYELCKGFLEKGFLLPESFEIYTSSGHIMDTINENKAVFFNTLETYGEVKNFKISSRLLNSYKGHFELLIDSVKSWKEKQFRVIVLSGGESRGHILEENFKKNGIEAIYQDEIVNELLPGQVVITRGSLQTGFEYQDTGFVVVSGKDFFGERKRPKKSFGKKSKGKKIGVFTDLNINDYVVHQIYGIGRYVGVEQLEVDSIKKDYLKIQYFDGDFLYVPTNQLDLIQKYIGSEGRTPRLSKLGGNDWAKTKARAKESLMELAEELIGLYAKRESLKGYKYNEDTVWQKQFEELFPFQETEDQLKCIDEIKKDMESEKLMDRLLCGDVGYGKTEVAVRAIFKAVMDGKQVAYLVPTTVLAQQQFENFRERMKDFPISVEVISRFKTKREQAKILKDVRSGMVDVLIGTHRLLQKDIEFKDLGLLIIDEEQRFGVKHKERIKNMKVNIDVLTLTATPIPRTLHMSLMGIRDISTIEDPPEERYPVQTYVMEHNPEVIKEAINRELARGGQIFYLFNRVRSINIKAAQIKKLVPDAKVAVAHGQMKESELENIMFQFVEGEYDVLVCTTIIESGLDMPNVNTIIVEDADRMGLAQLYQLRGRVGRSNRLAYAYITYKRDKVLSEIAEKRLQAIKEFTEFGSGFKVAMRDLQIRGAGNLLGSQQHGNIDLVGYDMYVRLLSEAINELRGIPLEEKDIEVSVDFKVNAYIDSSYINNENQKIEMYKKIASINDQKDVFDVRDELIDRYGKIPKAVDALIQIAYLKVLAKECGFLSLQEKDDYIILQFMEDKHIDIDIIGKLMEKYRRKILFAASSKPYITFKINEIKREKLLESIKILLQDVIELQ